jgi:hypothetical protein
MNGAVALKSTSLVEALRASFQTALRTGDSAPVALVWTDSDGEWRSLFPVLRAALSHLYRLGPYDPANHTGPAIWLRCVVDRTLPEIAPPGLYRVSKTRVLQAAPFSQT